METRKVRQIKLTIKNSRTGQERERMLEVNGHGALTDYGLEALMVIGADLYASGWDKQEFSVSAREIIVREVLRVRK